MADYADPVDRRIAELLKVLRERARTARIAARQEGLSAPQVAALRGKAMGYHEGADLAAALLAGGKLRQRWHDPEVDARDFAGTDPLAQPSWEDVRGRQP